MSWGCLDVAWGSVVYGEKGRIVTAKAALLGHS